MTQAYPLSWPTGWRRTPAAERRPARFFTVNRSFNGYVSQQRGVTVAESVKRVLRELDRMRADDPVISTNLALRRDGFPLSDQRAPADPGAAVYWTDGRRRNVMAIDIYSTVADNLAAIAATLDAMRAIERHGGAMVLERAFTGFAAIAAPDNFDAWAILGLRPGATPDSIRAKFAELAKRHHPDAGGDRYEFEILVRARNKVLSL
jgi:hypothetical protein